jgi:outer membrane protein assembly factor BamB
MKWTAAWRRVDRHRRQSGFNAMAKRLLRKRKVIGMRKFLSIVLASGLVTVLWGADWASQSGNPQRDGWARGEEEIVKGQVQGLKLLYKTKLDNESKGLASLTSPIILSNLITYLGFKEMLFVGGSSDNVYSIDAALNRLIWKTHFENEGDSAQASATPGCPGGLTASVAITGGRSPMRGGFHRPRKAASAAGPQARRRPAAPVNEGVFASGFGRNGYVFAIDSSGYLRFVRQSDGNATAVPPVKFLPPNSKVSAININGTIVYAATVDGCGSNPNALYAVDLGGAEQHVVSFPTNGSGLSGKGGTAISENGTVYVQVDNGHGDVAGGYNSTVLALNPEDLKVEDYFTPSGTAPAAKKGIAAPGATPTVFTWKGKELVIAAGRDGTVYLLDAESLGGADHHTPLAQTAPIAAADKQYAGHGIWGDFATWEDLDSGTRWVYASLWGPAGKAAKFATTNGESPNGSIVAFKVEEKNGKPALVPEWISRDLTAPVSPITTNGLVFALSTGESSRLAKKNGDLYTAAEREKMAAHATMYALDGTTGKELFSTGDDVTTFSHGSGLALANGRVYFTTHDNTIYCYGFPAMQPQLTER